MEFQRFVRALAMRERAFFFFAPLKRIRDKKDASVTKETTTQPALSDDILWGCEAIAAEINRPTHITFRMLQQGLIPADKIGAIWTSTRTRLRAHFGGAA